MDENQIIEATIKNVGSKIVNKKDGSGQIKLYEIELDNGHKYTTKFRQQAEEAYNLVGRRAKLSVKIAQNGEFKNFYLQSVIGEVFEPTHPTMDSFDKITESPNRPGKSGAEKDTDIHRQVALKVAAALRDSGDSTTDFRTNVDVLFRFLESGEWPEDSYFANVSASDADDIPF